MSGKDKTRIGPISDKEHEFMKDNEFIHNGYRLNFNSTKKIFRSLFMIHNESVNVWSHLLGVLIFLILFGFTIAWLGLPAKVAEFHIIEELKSSIMPCITGIANSAYKYEEIIESQLLDIYNDAYTLGHELEEKVFNMYNQLNVENTTERFRPLIKKFESILERIDGQDYDWIDVYNERYKEIQKINRWPIFVFMVSAMICMLCSSIFHLFNAHSSSLNKNMSTLDYAGISILVAGSFYPPIYYTFYCHVGSSYLGYIWLYLSGITIASVITFIISFIPGFQSPKMRWFRGVIFLILAFLGLIPFSHLMFFSESHNFLPAVWYFLAMGASYIIGVIIYIIRIPERFYPGKFDFIGHSHNIWHLFVLLAAIFHYLGSLEVYHLRQQLKCQA